MEKVKKIKLIIGISYLILIGTFFYYLLSKFSFQEITSYEFIKNNRDYFFELRDSNIFLTATASLIFIILWVFPFLGFGTPVALIGGFILGKWLGLIIVVLG